MPLQRSGRRLALDRRGESAAGQADEPFLGHAALDQAAQRRTLGRGYVHTVDQLPLGHRLVVRPSQKIAQRATEILRVHRSWFPGHRHQIDPVCARGVRLLIAATPVAGPYRIRQEPARATLTLPLRGC